MLQWTIPDADRMNLAHDANTHYIWAYSYSNLCSILSSWKQPIWLLMSCDIIVGIFIFFEDFDNFEDIFFLIISHNVSKAT